MAPTVVKAGAFRLFFFSREETRMHIHVNHTDGEAKFCWSRPSHWPRTSAYPTHSCAKPRS